MDNKLKKWLILAVCIIGCIGFGSLPTVTSTEALRVWFPTIIKPSWNPPSYLFGPVWTLLFTLMGIALWQIIYSNNIARTKAIQLFIGQFILNMLWTILFFTMQSPGLALIEIVVLWIAIVLTIRAFLNIKKSAGLLLVPYICWVSFAAVLNATIWWLNK